MGRVIGVADAMARTIVCLPDGRVGRLVYVSRISKVAKVRVDGRHVRVPAAELVEVDECSPER